MRHSDGAVCAEGHLTCRDCLEGYVVSCSDDDLAALRRREGKVVCPQSGELGCNAVAWSDSDLGQAVSAAVFEGYLKGKMRLLEVQNPKP